MKVRKESFTQKSNNFGKNLTKIQKKRKNLVRRYFKMRRMEVFIRRSRMQKQRRSKKRRIDLMKLRKPRGRNGKL